MALPLDMRSGPVLFTPCALLPHSADRAVCVHMPLHPPPVLYLLFLLCSYWSVFPYSRKDYFSTLLKCTLFSESFLSSRQN